MDHRIYGRLNRTDLGIYGTRRYPKGQSALQDVPTGPTQPTDPNANPQPIALIFRSTNEGVHAETLRWRYEVPVGRRAIVQSAIVEHSRVTVAVGTTMATSLIRANIKNISNTAADILRVVSHDNNDLRDSHRENLGVSFELFEGDVLFANTALGLGSAAMLVEARLIEYDSNYRVRQGYAIGDSFNPGNSPSTPVLSRSSGGVLTPLSSRTSFSQGFTSAPAPATTVTGPRAKVAIPIYSWDGRRIG